ncbi:tetratricopeptide repeat protein [SAR86 cluster bacterium]|nr:tetratricopeptide repeat protein [SAR86 cluster bacterium]
MKNIFFSFFLLSTFTIFSEENESLELLYKKIEVLEEEIRDLRNILEENSTLVDRSLELQQQRYLDLDSRILEISKISSEKLSSVDEEGQYSDSEEKELFKSALILFEESRFAEALEIFSQIIITFPNGAFTADAYFWSGELFLAQEMYEDAKLSFKNVVDNFYQHSRAPDSLFKLGEIYRIEGDIAGSLGFYNRVNEDFPDSGASQLSKKSQEILKEESNLLE